MPRHLINIDYDQTQAVLYVERKFSGPAMATVNDDGTVTSTNSEYNQQRELAQVGSQLYPWPDPYSAREKALQLQSEGVDIVQIYITPNYVVTIGSPVLTENGTKEASMTENEQPDIMIANTDVARKAASLYHHNINYNFGYKSQIINICKTYMIYFMWMENVLTEQRCNILGEGTFKWIYGQAQGFQTRFIHLMGNPLVYFKFEAELITANMWDTIRINGFQYVQFDFNKYWVYDNGFSVSSNYDWVTAGLKKPIYICNINDYRRGRDLFSGLAPAAEDYWAGMSTSSFYGHDAHIHIKNFRINDHGSSDGSVFRHSGAELRNNTVNVTIDNFHHTYTPNKQSTSPFMQILRTESPLAAEEVRATLLNNNIRVHIKNGMAEGVFGNEFDSLSTTRDSKVVYQLDNYIHVPTPGGGPTAAIRFTFYGEFGSKGNQIKFSGNVTNFADTAMLNVWNWTNQTNPDGLAVRFENCTFNQKAPAQKGLVFDTADPLIKMSFKNVTIATDGTAETISQSVPVTMLSEGLTINGPINSNITLIGSAPLVVPTLGEYINR